MSLLSKENELLNLDYDPSTSGQDSGFLKKYHSEQSVLALFIKRKI